MTQTDTTTYEIDKLPELILPFEHESFLWLHNVVQSDFLDTFMFLYSGKILWIPLCVVLLVTLFYKSKWQNAVLFILCFVLLATLCDQISASVIKPFFSRLRPTHHPDFMHYVQTVNGYRGGRYGFISAHAANGFGVATFISLVFRQRLLTCSLFLWASITAYSRIYLGVHFISDVVGGMILGAVLGFLVYLLFQYLRIRLFNKTFDDLKSPIYTALHARIIVATLGLTVSFALIYSLIQLF